MEKQFNPATFEVKKVKMFKFSPVGSGERYIVVQFKRELVTGWQLALQAGNKAKFMLLTNSSH